MIIKRVDEASFHRRPWVEIERRTWDTRPIEQPTRRRPRAA
jgi:hypothetical protein